MTVSPATLAAGIFAASLLVGWLSKRRSPLPLPPGPKRLPIIGNLLDMPKEKDWIVYQELAKKYGDVICLKALGTHIVVLNSAKSIFDLLEARSSVYSDRPIKQAIVMFGHMWSFALWGYGPEWRRHRRLMHEELQPAAIAKYQSIQFRGARVFVKRLLDNTEDVHVTIRKCLGTTIVDLAYGLEEQSDVENFINTAAAVGRHFSRNAVPGAYLVDFIPALKYVPTWFPFATTQREAVACWKEALKQLVDPIVAVKRNAASGRALRSVVTNMADKLKSGDMSSVPDFPDNSGMHEIPANTYTAGIDTSVSAATFFFLAMVLNPAIQVAAQKEIDEVVGPDRLPDFSDYENLPYVQAIVLESLRWFTPLPIALPHATLEDSTYNGYFIPKGSVILGNSWAVLRNPVDYPEPEVFRPERFLTSINGKAVINKEVRDPRTIAFGFGRRICPGKFLAEQTLFSMYSAVLAAYTISPGIDDQGVEMLPILENMQPGLMLHPAPFKCRCRPRSVRAAELIVEPLPDRGL